MVRLVAAARIDPSRTTTAPIGTSLRFTASRARSSALRMYCSSSASPLPTAPSSVVRVGLSACKRRLGRLPEGQLALGIAIDDDVIALVELALEHRQRQRILQQPLNRPLEWPRAERGIVPLGREHLPRRRRQLERETALGEKLL